MILAPGGGRVCGVKDRADQAAPAGEMGVNLELERDRCGVNGKQAEKTWPALPRTAVQATGMEMRDEGLGRRRAGEGDI